MATTIIFTIIGCCILNMFMPKENPILDQVEISDDGISDDFAENLDRMFLEHRLEILTKDDITRKNNLDEIDQINTRLNKK